MVFCIVKIFLTFFPLIIVIISPLLPHAPLTEAQAQTSELVNPQPYQRNLKFSGFTRPKTEMLLRSEVTAQCLEVYADEGQELADSGLFARLDDVFIRLDIQANELEQEKIQRELRTARKNLQRYTVLRKKNTAAQTQLDDITLQVDLYEIALRSLVNAQRRLNELHKRHSIRAPVGWQVVERMVEPGEYIQAGQALARLGDLRTLIIPLQMSWRELQSLRNTPVLSLYFSQLESNIPATIHSISADFDAKSKKIPVELELDSRQEHLSFPLRAGMRGELSLQIPGKAQTFILPRSAVLERYNAHWVVRENLQRVQVIFLGLSDDGDFAVVAAGNADGLRSTDRVLKTVPLELD